MNDLMKGIGRQRLASTYRSRFKNVLRVLGEVKKSRYPFDLRFWSEDVSDARRFGFVYKKELFEPGCSTVCCAIGHCGNDTVFQSQGFVSKDGGISFYPKTQFDKKVVAPEVYYGYPAVRVYLGVDKAAVEALFDPSCYVHEELMSISSVEDRIRWFMENRVDEISDHEFLLQVTGTRDE